MTSRCCRPGRHQSISMSVDWSHTQVLPLDLVHHHVLGYDAGKQHELHACLHETLIFRVIETDLWVSWGAEIRAPADLVILGRVYDKQEICSPVCLRAQGRVMVRPSRLLRSTLQGTSQCIQVFQFTPPTWSYKATERMQQTRRSVRFCSRRSFAPSLRS